MSRRVVGPFRILEHAMSGLTTDVSQEDALAVMWLVYELFLQSGCKCAGANKDAVHDVDWSGDLSELVMRAIPHEIFTEGVPATVSVKLGTLRAEVDGNNEICAWLYEES